jgi:hypothetical protein
MGRPLDANPAAFFVPARKLFGYRDSRHTPRNKLQEMAKNRR